MGTTPLRVSSLSALALFVGFFAVGGSAAAGETTLSVLGLEPAAGAPESVGNAVTEALRQRATSTPNYRLVPGRDLVEVKLVFSCPDEAPTCMTQAAQSIGASKLIFGNVQPIGTDAFLVTLKILDAQRGVVENWISEQITKAQVAPVTLRVPVQKWFAALTGQALPGTIKITGGVVGATVLLDGVQAGLMGTEGLTLAGVAAGQHQLVVSRVGYEKFERNLTLAAGATEKVVVQLKAIEGAAAAAAEAPAAPPPPPPQVVEHEEEPPAPPAGPAASRIAAWALLGTAVVAIGLGGYSSWRVNDINNQLDRFRRYGCIANPDDRRCTADGKNYLPPPDAKEVAEVNRLKLSGDDWVATQWVGYGLGAALLVTSAVFMYHGYSVTAVASAPSQKRPSLVVMPSFGPGSAGAMAYVRF